VVVLDRLVAPGRLDTADEGIDGIVAEGQATGAVGPPEMAIHGFSNERGKRQPAPPGLVLELAVCGLGEAHVRRHVSRHRDITVLPRRA
jgi:hypothetical protein